MSSLLLLCISHSLTAQTSKEERLIGMYNSIKTSNYATFVNDYVSADFFEIVSKDSLIKHFEQYEGYEGYKIQMISYATRKPSKVVELDNVKYFKTFVDKKYKLTLNRSSFEKDSINRAQYLDSLREEMKRDTVYQNRLLTDTLDMSWMYYDFPYYEVSDDGYDYVESVENAMYTTLMYMEEGYKSAFGKKIEIAVDYDTFSFYFSEIDQMGTVGILNPSNSKEWQFLGYLDNFSSYLPYLLPDSIQKKLKLKW